MNLLSLLAGTMLSQSSVNSVSGKTGLSSKQIQKLVMLALPILIKYMTQNASSGDGALSLLGALSQHKNNNSMDLQLKDADEEDGAKIIHHILGRKENAVTQDLSAQTGLGTDQVQQVLSILAPGLMSGAETCQSAGLSAHRRRNLRFPPRRRQGRSSSGFCEPSGQGRRRPHRRHGTAQPSSVSFETIKQFSPTTQNPRNDDQSCKTQASVMLYTSVLRYGRAF